MPVKKKSKKTVSNTVVDIEALNAAIVKAIGTERGAISAFARKIGLSTASISRVRSREIPGLTNYIAIVRGLKRKFEDFIV